MSIVITVPGSGAAPSSATYEALQASIARWLNRTDLTDVIPDFVLMAEAEFSRDPRIRSAAQTTRLTGMTADGTVPLPEDMLELKCFKIEDEEYEFLPPETFYGICGGRYYTRDGATLVAKDEPQGDWELSYLARLPALQFPSDTNWLLQNHYDVYLWKCCEQGSVWLRDVDGAQGYRAKYDAAVSQMLDANNRHEWAGFPLHMRAPGVV